MTKMPSGTSEDDSEGGTNLQVHNWTIYFKAAFYIFMQAVYTFFYN